MVDPAPLHVVGIVGGEHFGRAAGAAIDGATVVVGSPRHLATVALPTAADRVPLTGPLPPLVELVAQRRAGGERVTVLASGDPGFFGISRMLIDRFGAEAVRSHPAPSSVALAFARAGLSWEDATVASAHGRALGPAVAAARRAPKAAVLTSPANPPEALGAALVAAGCGPRAVTVASRLGEDDEAVVHTDLRGLAAGRFDPMSVVVLHLGSPPSAVLPAAPAAAVLDHSAPTLSWGADETSFAQRPGMITKAEVRGVALAKLRLPRSGVLWDVGAGSGSVGVEAASIAPGLRVYAIERNGDDAANITTNARTLGAVVDVIVGEAPGVLASLPDPDRVFVGGGGPAVMRAAWARLRPGGTLVATFVVLQHAVQAMELLADLVQLQVSRAVPIGTVGVRLEPLNPVFVCSGQR